jgi:dolichol kinase
MDTLRRTLLNSARPITGTSLRLSRNTSGHYLLGIHLFLGIYLFVVIILVFDMMVIVAIIVVGRGDV